MGVLFYRTSSKQRSTTNSCSGTEASTSSLLFPMVFVNSLYFVKDNFGRCDDGWVSGTPNGGIFGRSSGDGGGGFRRGKGFGSARGFGSDNISPRRDGFRLTHERAPKLQPGIPNWRRGIRESEARPARTQVLIVLLV